MEDTGKCFNNSYSQNCSHHKLSWWISCTSQEAPFIVARKLINLSFCLGITHWGLGTTNGWIEFRLWLWELASKTTQTSSLNPDLPVSLWKVCLCYIVSTTMTMKPTACTSEWHIRLWLHIDMTARISMHTLYVDA